MEEKKYNKLFVGGDLSGIQKFLYNITSRHASVSLKGRSAFLSDYLRKVCNKIEETIEGYGGEYDELYCSGGKFYLITDNTPAITKAIDDCAKSQKAKLWDEHKGQLGLNISHVAFYEEAGKFHVEGHDDELNTSSGVLWKYVNADFACQKNQKFKDLLMEHPNRFFGFNADNEDTQELIVGSGHKVCALTGVEFDITKLEKGARYTIDDDEDKDLFYLPSAIKQIEDGKRLSKEQGLKSFNDYASGSYLGILRMDVDNMGKRFIIGFSSLDEYRKFSERSRVFFEETIRNEFLLIPDPITGEPYRNFLNIIYAGGDDLFIVGRWDKVIDFAKLIHDKTIEEFKDESYTDIFNPNKPTCHISISGGIAIVKPKFPIAQSAKMAGDAEDAAKQGAKNAFNMFGRTISWDSTKPYEVNEKESYEHEYAYVEHFKNKFVRYIKNYKDEGFSKSILHKIVLYSELADKNIEREAQGKSTNYRYMWHFSYYLTRFMEKFKGFEKESNEQKKSIKKELYAFCRKLRDEQFTKSRNVELLALSARWAELLLKDNEQYN